MIETNFVQGKDLPEKNNMGILGECGEFREKNDIKISVWVPVGSVRRTQGSEDVSLLSNVMNPLHKLF